MAGLTYRAAIVIIPPVEVWAAIQAIRERHDRKVRRWMPHITLVYPFWPREEFGRAVEVLTPVCARVRRFELGLEQFGVFAHGRGEHTMWLDPEPEEAVGEMYEAARAGLGIGKEGRAFRPHLSVGQVRGRREMEVLVGKLQAAWRPIRFLVREVSLIWREDPPGDVFRVGERVGLGEAGNGNVPGAR